MKSYDKELEPCPLCGSKDFDIFENTDSQVGAIYCFKCPYGVEDSELTIEELIECHNKRI